MSACILTFVCPASAPGSSQDVTDASAAPFPFCSMPLARSTTLWAASRDSIVTVPANDIDTGPNFAWSTPLQLWSSITSVSSAPGMHGATFSTSSRYAHTPSAGAPTVNSFSISTDQAPDAAAAMNGAGSVVNRSRQLALQK